MDSCTKIKGLFVIQSFSNDVPGDSAARMCSMKKWSKKLLLIKDIGSRIINGSKYMPYTRRRV